MNHRSLLNLPAELRLKILQYLTNATTIKIDDKNDNRFGSIATIEDGTVAWPLLQTCKQLRLETSPLIKLSKLIIWTRLTRGIYGIFACYISKIQDLETTMTELIDTYPHHLRQLTGLQRILITDNEQTMHTEQIPSQVQYTHYIRDVLVPLAEAMAASRLQTILNSSRVAYGKPATTSLKGWFDGGAVSGLVEVAYDVRYMPCDHLWAMRPRDLATLPSVRVHVSLDGRDPRTWVDDVPVDEMMW